MLNSFRTFVKYLISIKPKSHEKAIKNLLNILLIALLTLLIQFIIINIVKERKKKITYVDLISVPDTLYKKHNINDKVITREFIQKLYDIRNKTHTRVVENEFKQSVTKEEQLNIEILDNSIDLSGLINYFADYKREKNYISGEIIHVPDSKQYVFNIRVMGKQKIRYPIQETQIASLYDSIMSNIADSVYRLIEPYQYCLYKYQNYISVPLDSLIKKLILQQEPFNLPANNLLGLYYYRKSLYSNDTDSAIKQLLIADTLYSKFCADKPDFTPLYSDFGHVLLQLALLGSDSLKHIRNKGALIQYRKSKRRTPLKFNRFRENDPRVYCRIIICKIRKPQRRGLKRDIKNAKEYLKQGQEGFDNYSALNLIDEIEVGYNNEETISSNMISLAEELDKLIIQDYKKIGK